MADILMDNQAAPSTPAAGKSVLYVDSTTKRLAIVDDAGRFNGFLSGNDATASQVLGTADTYVTNSGILIPSMGMKAGQLYRWYMFITKTAASTAAATVIFRTGSTQTTADTARSTITSAAQTAVVDGGLWTLTCQVRNVGASGQIVTSYSIGGKRAADAAGFGNSALDNIPATFDNTAQAGLYLGVSINPGASSAWTITTVEAKLTG